MSIEKKIAEIDAAYSGKKKKQNVQNNYNFY